jgi:ABC-type uncharacterized transport system permease subunit
MTSSFAFSIGALLALLPAAAVRFRAADRRDGLFWAGAALALLGPLLWAASQVEGGWRTSFAVSLWVTIATTMLIFVALAALSREAWRLTPLLVPYLLVLGVLATIWQHAPSRPLDDAVPAGWLEAHIVAAVLTYGLLTLAAVAALAVFLQERALKLKRPTSLTRRLPPIAATETLLLRLLVACEIVLGIGVLSGMAAQHFINAGWLPLDHKTIFSLGAFVVIGILLALHRLSGLRGRRAVRGILLAYLLLTLAFPGVKFVTDVLMQRGTAASLGKPDCCASLDLRQ